MRWILPLDTLYYDVLSIDPPNQTMTGHYAPMPVHLLGELYVIVGCIPYVREV